MTLETVRAFLAAHAPDVEVLVTEASSATVALAAAAHGVEPAQIAKTICLRVGEQTMLIVAGGLSRLDNRKFKDRFGGKPRACGYVEDAHPRLDLSRSHKEGSEVCRDARKGTIITICGFILVG